MKPAVAPYQTAAWCVRIVCVTGLTVRLTAHPVDLSMGGNLYRTDSGYQPSAYSAAAAFSPPAIDIEGIVAVAGISRDALASGVFDGARVYVFRTNYLNPVEDEEPVAAGFFGKVVLEDDKYRIEGMGLVDALNQSVGRAIMPGCDRVFGDSRCGISLASVQVTGVLTSVTNAATVRDAARTEAADWFGSGVLEYTSGPNAGLRPLGIRSSAADGTIVTFDPAYHQPQIGDAYRLTPGCRKRREDCRDKWSNIVNFGGFPDQPTSSTYLARGTK